MITCFLPLGKDIEMMHCPYIGTAQAESSNMGLTATPTVSTGQQLLRPLVSIGLLCAQTEAAYGYGISTWLQRERERRGGESMHLIDVNFTGNISLNSS